MNATAQAPYPWRIEEPDDRYMRIVDATGNPICDFYPFATRGGRGHAETRAIAELIVDIMNRGG